LTVPRVAVVHDWLTGMRGGEKVLLSLLRLFPDAALYTLLHVKGSVAPEIEAREIHTSFLQHLPGVEALYRHFLPLFPAAAASLDLSAYDLVVSSSHCVAKGVRPGEGALHLCYCHTPMRYVWDRYDDYFGPGRVSGLAARLIPRVAEGLRAWDVATAGRVAHYAANSAYVAARIRRYYGREAEVIPPPVDTDFFTPGPEAGGGYDLVVSALAPYKRIDMVLEAYRGTGRPLRIVGTGPEALRLRRLAPPEASFLGWVDDVALRELYRGCRAVIMPGVEDFGIVPVEAMACGRPAVVLGEGGGAESVTPGETGVVLRDATREGLRAAIDSLERVRFNPSTLRARAETYGRQVFEARFRDFVFRASKRLPFGSRVHC
jgi:glycosyltransferase involved in cell wall biosynthesis